MHSEKVGAFKANRTEKVGAFRANKTQKGGLYRGTYPYCFNMGVPPPGLYIASASFRVFIHILLRILKII